MRVRIMLKCIVELTLLMDYFEVLSLSQLVSPWVSPLTRLGRKEYTGKDVWVSRASRTLPSPVLCTLNFFLPLPEVFYAEGSFLIDNPTFRQIKLSGVRALRGIRNTGF
jgi:hypothetical protein